MIEKHRCFYCGQEGRYQLKNGKWCCQKSHNSCPARRIQAKNKVKRDYVAWRASLPLETQKRMNDAFNSKESHEKAVKTLREKYATGQLVGSWIGRHHTEDTKRKIGEKTSKLLKEAYANGTKTPAKGVGRGKYSYFIIDDKKFLLRSTYEFIYALYLSLNHQSFSYESVRVANSTSFDGPNTFISDFVIGNLIIEVKGRKTKKDDIERLSFEHAGYDFKILYKNNIDNLVQVLEDKYKINVKELIGKIITGHNSKQYFVFDFNKFHLKT